MANFLKSAKTLLMEGKSAIGRAIERKGASKVIEATEGEAIKSADHLFGGPIRFSRPRMPSAPGAADSMSDLPIRKNTLSVGRPQNADHLFPTATSPGIMDLPIKKGSKPMQPQSTNHLFSGRVGNAPTMQTSGTPDIVDLPVRKGKGLPGMQSVDPLFSGHVAGTARPTAVQSATTAGDVVSDLPIRKGKGLGGAQSTDSLFSGQVTGATTPRVVNTPADTGLDLPIAKGKSPLEMQSTDHLFPGRSAPPAVGTSQGKTQTMKDAVMSGDAEQQIGALARREDIVGLPTRPRPMGGEIPAVGGVEESLTYANEPSSVLALRDTASRSGEPSGVLAVRNKSNTAPATAAAAPAENAKPIIPTGITRPDRDFNDLPEDIIRMKDPSRLIDWATGPAIGAVIGGAEGFINYDPSKEKDPLMKETPFIARMKAAGEGAAKGAGIAVAGVAGERMMVGIGKSLMSAEQRALLPGPISLTEAFSKGFSSTAGAKGTDSMESIMKGVSGTFDETSGYVASVKVNAGIKAEEAVTARMAQVRATAATGTSAAPAATPVATQAASAAATATPAAAAPTRRYTVQAPPSDFRAGSTTYTPPPAPAAAAATPAAATPTAPAAAVQAAATNAPTVERRAALEQLNRRREKIRSNTMDSLMSLPDHMTPERVSSIVNSSRGLVDAGVITATAAGALAGTPILMAKQALYNYKEHVLKPNEKTSQVAARGGFGPRIQNPWLGEGTLEGEYAIRDTLPAQLGDGPISKIAGTAAIIGAVGVPAMLGAVSATSYGGGPGHPINAFKMRDPAVSAQAQMQADASNKIRMSDPSQLGLADAEEMYYTNPSMRPVQSRSRPGMYNDTGNLTLALSALRRG